MGLKNLLTKTRTINIQSCLPDATILISTDGIIQWINEAAEEMFQKDMVGTNLDNYINGGVDVIEAAIKIKQPTVAKTSNNQFVEITVKEIEGAYVISMRDITKKYKTENNISDTIAETKKIDIDKNSFLLKVGNDLKSPLHSIIGFSQAIIDGLGGKTTLKQEKYLNIINKNSTDLLYFFEKLLTLAETENLTFDKDVKKFDIISGINSIIKITESIYADKNVNVTLSVPENFNKVFNTDENAFKILFKTLLETILYATDMGTIQIVLENADEEFLATHNMVNIPAVIITIVSNNNSILETEISTLFNPYDLTDYSNKKAMLRAISLASVRNIANYLNGLIWAETISGQGTTFKLVLPFEKGGNE